MRGDAERQANIMLAVTPDSFIPDDHPIRRIKPIVDAALQQLSPLFDTEVSARKLTQSVSTVSDSVRG